MPAREPDLERLRRYAYARNRDVDTEPRTICVTDDEMIWILEQIDYAS